MKKSNKWLLAAILLLLGSLSAYNLGLRAEYRRGAYKDPLRDTSLLKFKDFTTVNIQAANAMNVKIVAGPYGVRLSNAAAQYVRVSQEGSRLTVALVYPAESEYLGTRDVVTIACPQLKQLITSASYTSAGKLVTEKQNGRGYKVLVQGFTADSLQVQQHYASRVELVNNQLGYLRAEAGAGPGSHSVLHIAKNNRIQAADLALQHESELQLESKIGVPRYTFTGDSIRATLAGTALGNLER